MFVYLVDPLAAYVGAVGRGENRTLASYLDVREAEAGPMWFVAVLLPGVSRVL